MKTSYFKYLIYGSIFISVLPFLLLLFRLELRGGFAATYANVSGLIGATLMLWQLLLSNRFIVKKITPNYVSSIKLHTLLGIYGFFFIFTHPILEMFAYGENLAFLLLPDLSTRFSQYVAFGRIALYLYLLIWLTSAVIRDRIPYRLWRYIHYATFAVPFLVFIHANAIGTFLRAFPLLKLYWYILALAYATFIIVRFAQALNSGKKKYKLVNKAKGPNNIYNYTFEPLQSYFVPQIGQFFFIKAGEMSESHPFTVMDFDANTKQLRFGIQNVGKYTDYLSKLETDDEVYLDGPYGVFTKEAQSDQPKVIIAGGVGATPFVKLVDKYGDNNTFMFHANRYLKNVLNRNQFKKKLDKNYIDIISREEVNEEQVINGRINADIISDNLPRTILSSANFFVCGSKGFMESVIDDLKQLGVEKQRIFMEEFSF